MGPPKQVEFIRPKHVAENFVDVADDEVTGMLTAVVFKVRPLLLLSPLPCVLTPPPRCRSGD